MLFAVALTCFGQAGHPAATQAPQTGADPQTPTKVSADANAQPIVANKDASADKDAKPQKAAMVENERKKQISDESTQLLAMAVELKTEVDKTTKDTLSLTVIRKADAIERLAKTVKDKIKSSGPS